MGKVTPAFGSVRTFEYDIATMTISMTSFWVVGVNEIAAHCWLGYLSASALRKTFCHTELLTPLKKPGNPEPTYQKCLKFELMLRPCGGFLDRQGQTNWRWLDRSQLEWCYMDCANWRV